MAALEALASPGGPEAFAALRKAALEDPDPALRDKAAAILESRRPDADPYLADLPRGGVDARARAAAADVTELTMESEDRAPGR
jgi:hypothetical protein